MDVCPTHDLLLALANGSIDDDAASQCELHLHNCEPCRRRLANLFATPDSHILAWRSGASSDASIQSAVGVQPAKAIGAAAHRLWVQHVQTRGTAAEGNSKPDVEARFEPGQWIGRYRVERVLGCGGFGLVVAALDEKLRRSVAIKIPHAHVIRSPEQLEFALTEARTVASLDHSSIVPIYDVGSTDTQPLFLVSKLINGQSLAECIKLGAIPIVTAVRWVADIADALDYAHSRGVIHRDVKPQNILIDDQGQALITDFGLAWSDQRSSKCESDGCEARTAPRAGTPAYMAPEQLVSDATKITPRTDVYALGRVLGELLETAESNHAVASSLNQPTTDQDRVLHKILEKAVAPVPEDRYSSAALLAEALEEYLGQATRHRWMAGWPRSLVAVSALLLVIGLCCAGYMGYRAIEARQRNQQVSESVEGLLGGPLAQVPLRLGSVEQLGQEAIGLLQNAAQAEDPDRRLRAQLSLLRMQDANDCQDSIEAVSEAILTANVDRLGILIEATKDQAGLFRPAMLETLQQRSNVTSDRLLNATQFLAATSPDESIWSDTNITKSIAQALMLDDTATAHLRAEALGAVGKQLSQGLSRLVAESPRIITAERNQHFYQVWAILAGSDVEEVVELLAAGPLLLMNPVLKQLRDDEPTRQYLTDLLNDSQPVRNPIKRATKQRVAALALLSLGHEEEFWSRWKHSHDPSFVTNMFYCIGTPPLTKSYILAHLVRTGALEPVKELPNAWSDYLFSETLSQRRYLLESLLVNHSTSQLEDVEIQRLVVRLRDLAAHDADPAVHTISAKLLTTLGREFPPHIEPKPACQVTLNDKLRWHHNLLGQTMVHIPSKVGGFAIASCEVERRHFEQFLAETEYPWTGVRMENNTPEDSLLRSCPQLEMSWYDCAAFCNWLSRKEGLDECFEPNVDGEFASGMRIKLDACELNGYRMPTNIEWTEACRAAAATMFYFGNGVFTPADYMWMLPHSKGEGQPVGQLRPNMLGLYDMHGNAAEWTLNDTQIGLQLGEVTNEVPRVHRGGSISDTSMRALGSATRAFSPPHQRHKYTGLRLVRSLK